MSPDAVPEHELNFAFEYGDGLFLETYSKEESRWAGPIHPEDLPISTGLREDLERLGTWYNTSLNWDYPPDPGPWRQDECDRFNTAADTVFRRLREELGPTWNVTSTFGHIQEDPELDRYLADPRNFRRDN